MGLEEIKERVQVFCRYSYILFEWDRFLERMELDHCVLNGVRTNGCYSLLYRLEQECLRNSQVLEDTSLRYLPQNMRLDVFEDFQRDRMSGHTL